MRILKVLTFVAVAGALAAGSAQAQTGKGHFTYTGSALGTQSCFGTATANDLGCGWLTSPYRAILKRTSAATWMLPNPPFGDNAFGSPVDVFCVDFTHHLMSYDANFSNLADGGSVSSYTRQGNVDTYKKAAWLIGNLPGTKTTLSNAINYAINGAIWNIMGMAINYTTGTTGINTDIAYWYNLANQSQNYSSINAAEWVVITPENREATGTSGGQEMMVQVVTPEPATLLLLGTGLLSLIAAGVLRRSVV